MKLVPENINEVQDFQRGRDPKRSMGVGMHRHFPSVREAMKYVADILPEILGTDEIPPNIIRSKMGFINGRYIDRISKYKDEYITWDWSPTGESWNVELFWELQERGFLNESVDFQRGQDPKDTLNIGNKEARMIQKIQNVADKFGFKKVEIPKDYDSSMWYNDYRTLGIWKLRDDENNNLGEGFRISTSVNLVYNSNPYYGDEYQVIGFDSGGDEIANYDLEYWLKPFGWREIIGSVDESMGFQRGTDPKEAMGIGRLADIPSESIRNAFACVRNYSLEDLENIYRRVKANKNISLDGVPSSKLSYSEWVDFHNKVVNGINSYKRRKTKAESPFKKGDILKVVHNGKTYLGVYDSVDKHGRIKALGHGFKLLFPPERYTEATPEEAEAFREEGILLNKKKMRSYIGRARTLVSRGHMTQEHLDSIIRDYEKRFGEKYES